MRGKVDKILLFSVAALVVIGLVFVYSASFYTAELSYGNRYFFLIKQLTGAIVGAVALTVMCFVKVDLLKRFYIVGVIVSVVLLALVFVPGIGVENYGAKRWIGFGSFSFQPSEIAKFAFVLFSACHLSGRLKGKFTSYIPTIVVGGVFCQRGMQDTRDVRVHVQHPALDDAQAGFYGVFPDVAHCHFGQHAGVRPGGDVADVSLPLELHALVRCRVDAFGFVPACGAYAALPRGAQIPFGGYRLVGGGALGFAVAGSGLFL